MKETDLFLPVKSYLEKAGYTVRAEVKNCDVTATMDDEIIIIELKLSVNIQLLIQATDRQRIADSVYVAVPRPSPRVLRSRIKGIKHILRRLEIGLIFVDLESSEQNIEIIFHPKKFVRRKQPKRKIALLKEISQRSENLNKGGVNKRKLVTAYRENAIQIAVFLDQMGEASPKELVKFGTGVKTQSILNKNFYKWFIRVSRGVYVLNEVGKTEIAKWPLLVYKYQEIYKQKKQISDE